MTTRSILLVAAATGAFFVALPTAAAWEPTCTNCWCDQSLKPAFSYLYPKGCCLETDRGTLAQIRDMAKSERDRWSASGTALFLLSGANVFLSLGIPASALWMGSGATRMLTADAEATLQLIQALDKGLYDLDNTTLRRFKCSWRATVGSADPLGAHAEKVFLIPETLTKRNTSPILTAVFLKQVSGQVPFDLKIQPNATDAETGQDAALTCLGKVFASTDTGQAGACFTAAGIAQCAPVAVPCGSDLSLRVANSGLQAVGLSVRDTGADVVTYFQGDVYNEAGSYKKNASLSAYSKPLLLFFRPDAGATAAKPQAAPVRATGNSCEAVLRTRGWCGTLEARRPQNLRRYQRECRKWECCFARRLGADPLTGRGRYKKDCESMAD